MARMVREGFQGTGARTRRFPQNNYSPLPYTSPVSCPSARPGLGADAPRVRKLQCDGKGVTFGADLRSYLVPRFQSPRRALDFRLSGHMQARFTAGHILNDELLTFPIQYITVDDGGRARLGSLQGFRLSDGCKDENKSENECHSPLLFY